jgi:hypothetical protein
MPSNNSWKVIVGVIPKIIPNYCRSNSWKIIVGVISKYFVGVIIATRMNIYCRSNCLCQAVITPCLSSKKYLLYE